MTTLQEGDKAPDFKVKNEIGEEMQLADFIDKKLVLYFYPKDSTPGCTVESCKHNITEGLLIWRAARKHRILNGIPDPD